MNSTSSVSHESISRRAYQLWEAAGQPDGNETAYWFQAERELHAQHGHSVEVGEHQDKSVEPPVAGGKRVREKAPHSTDYAHPGVTTDSLHHQRNR